MSLLMLDTPTSGEANLPKPCVVNVTQIQTIDRAYLQEKIGTVSHRVLQQVGAGVRLGLEVNGETPP